jgi:hypothetical protein
MSQDTYKFPDQYKGDTFWPNTFTIKEDGVPVDLTGALIKITFRQSYAAGSIQKSFSIGSGITVNDASGGKFTLDKILKFSWSAKNYFYDTEVTFPNNDVRTYFKGSLRVIQDGTNG